MIYEVRWGYWKSDRYPVAVTDDITYARHIALIEINKSARLTAGDFARFEEAFQAFQRNPERCLYFSVRDYHIEIRPSTLKIAIGGMSTI